MTCTVPGDGPRELPPVSAFASDDGSADPEVAQVLTDYAAGRADAADVVAALVGTRVLVPVLAHEAPTGDSAESASAGEAGEIDGTATGPTTPTPHTATTSIAAIQAPDGRTALPVFTSVDALARWRSDSRPMPLTIQQAAASALAEGWPLLVVDPAGPVTVALPRPAVQSLAGQLQWHPAVRAGQVRADVRDAIELAVTSVTAVRSVQVEPGRQAEVAVVVALPGGLDRQGLSGVLTQVNEALAASPLVTQVDSIELRPVPAP